MHPTLPVHLLQFNIAWEDPAANRLAIEQQLNKLIVKGHVVVLPEMFSTGFSMQPEQHAEAPDGPTVQWMKQQAQTRACILCGSIMIKENNAYYNRFVWMQPNGEAHTYNKRHLFGMAGEDKVYTAGTKRLVVQVNGWRIAVAICYDLRFPVWLRQQRDAEYDVLLVTANWPERRADAWNTLLKARAIENQCYVLGINRCGEDGNGLAYHGDTQIISPDGRILAHADRHNHVVSHHLSAPLLHETRQSLPFLRDKDDFMIL